MNTTVLKGKTFILGIGAQKSGTTWLARYFSKHPDVCFSPVKELHVFDTRFRPDMCKEYLKFRISYLSDLVNIAEDNYIDEINRNQMLKQTELIRMIFDDDAYISWFSEMCTKRCIATGEITPSYSLIPRGGFSYIKRLIEDHGMNPKVIFLMRDPIERHYSALRMIERVRGRSAADRFSASLSNEQQVLRGRYEITIENISEVFEEKQVHFEFYERLFTEPAVRKICDFFGISYVEPAFSKSHNRSPTLHPLTPAMIEQARPIYESTYRCCREKFGKDLPAAWNL